MEGASTSAGGNRPRNLALSVGFITLLTIALLLSRVVSYTLYHSLAETFYAIVGVTVFLIAWTLRDFVDDDFPLFLSVSLFAGAILHVVHMVDFPGVNIISPSLDSPTQVWLAATVLQAASFVVAPLFIGRRIALGAVLIGYLLTDTLILCSIYWWHVFPVCLGPGGLTTFKVVGEYIACGLLVGGIGLLWWRRGGLQRGVLPLMAAALAARAVAELSFTLYRGPHELPNLVGHVFLVLSIWMVYLAVVRDSLAVPHALAIANLRLSEQAARAESQREQLACEALDQVLALTPSFHEEKGFDEIAAAVCHAARGVFDCDAAVLFSTDGRELVGLAADPPSPLLIAGTRFPVSDDPDLEEVLAGRRPSFRAETSARTLGPQLAALAGEIGARSVLRAPIGLGPVAERLLVLAWTQPHEEPDAQTLALVQRFSDQADVALTQARRRELQEEAEALHRRFERSLLPNLPVQHPGVVVRSYYQPGEHRLELGGDFIDVLDRGERGLAVIMGDVSGHGPNSAALGATLRAAWQALELAGAAPADVVRNLDRVLTRERVSAETYATLCLAWIDPRRSAVSLMNIAHPPPVLIGESVMRLEVLPMPPLGSFEVPVDEPIEVLMEPGWSLFFYTDGLIEGRAAPGSSERYGEERLFHLLQQVDRPLDDVRLERLLADIVAAGGEPLTDDVTVVVVSDAMYYAIDGWQGTAAGPSTTEGA